MKKKQFALHAFSLLITGLFLILFLNPREPDRCAICIGLKRHAPCVLNLNTGKVVELELYEPHSRKVGEIAEAQDQSIFSFINIDGSKGTKTTNPWEIKINLPKKVQPTSRKHYCSNCRELLSHYWNGYVILDLYHPSSPIVYPVHDGATYSIRCYSISITTDAKTQQYVLEEIGTYNASLS